MNRILLVAVLTMFTDQLFGQQSQLASFLPDINTIKARPAPISRRMDLQVMSAEAIGRIEDHLPTIEPGVFADKLRDRNGILYDLVSMPPFIHAGSGQNFSQVFNNVPLIGRNGLGIANGLQPGSMRNRTPSSFPWQPVPGGTGRSSNVNSFKVIVLPKHPNGVSETFPAGLWPIVYHEGSAEGFQRPNPRVAIIDWTNPSGTFYFEPFTVNDPNGKQHYICIIRSRFKVADGSFGTESLTHFRTAAECRQEIVKRRPNWRESSQLISFISHLERPLTSPGVQIAPEVLTDLTAGNRLFGTGRGSAFSASARVDTLPPFDSQLISEVLDGVPLRASSGYQWKDGCNAPTAKGFHFVPEDYEGPFIALDSVGCANCHSGAKVSARRHFPNGEKKGWNGGNSEEILSFHIFEPSSVTNEPNPNPELRKKWVDAGILQKYDPRIHPDSVYLRKSPRRN